MRRININLNDKLVEELDRIAEEKGVSRSEVIRRGLDWYLENKGEVK